jgi:hypothetical protein
MLKRMPASIVFLRLVLGVLALLFAWQAGRTLVAYRRGELRQSRVVGWIVRAVVCGLGIIFPLRVIDAIVVTVWVLAVLAFVAGVSMAGRQKKAEDLTHTIFPDE